MERHEYTPDELLGTLSEVERQHAPRRLFLAGDPPARTRRHPCGHRRVSQSLNRGSEPREEARAPTC